MGVEEEFLLVGPSGDPVAVAAAVLGTTPDSSDGHDQGAGLQAELQQQQLETGTRPCDDLADLARQIRDGRAVAQVAAAAAGASIAALATSPLPVASTVTEAPRYRRIHREFALTAREQLTCGCHVHVAVQSDEEGVAVIDRIGPWLAPLLALSASSPFWQGVDSGYASYRSQVWNRWPTAGPTATFGSASAYHASVDALVESGTILDRGMVYFDARLSARYPTVEVRIADVCLDADDATLLAGLVRGLVETAAHEAATGRPPAGSRVEHLRAASWRAARSGLSGMLVHPLTGRPVGSAVAVDALVEHVRDALEETHDLDLAHELLERLRVRGTGADAQRAWFRAGGDLSEVVRRAALATLA